jgi:hypothetical protein
MIMCYSLILSDVCLCDLPWLPLGRQMMLSKLLCIYGVGLRGSLG